MPTVLTESKTISDLVKMEEEQRYSRDTVALAAAQTITIGTFIKSVATGCVAAGPTDTAIAGIAIQNATTTAAPGQCVVLARHAVIVESGIDYPAGATAAQKKALKAILLGMGIKTATEEGPAATL